MTVADEIAELQAELDAVIQQAHVLRRRIKRLQSKPIDYTLLGINTSGQDDSSISVSNRVDRFGKVGVARVYYPRALPFKWDESKEGASPEKRVMLSFKGHPVSWISGVYDDAIEAWLASVPADWTIYLTYWHEPNNELIGGVFSALQYRAAWAYISNIVKRTVTASPITLTTNFMSWGFWSDDWAPGTNVVDAMTFDVYGNGKHDLSDDYPPIAERLDPCLERATRLGFTRWGLGEFNAPRRTWDADESGRRAWLQSVLDYCRTNKAEFACVWEQVQGVGGSVYDQSFHTDATDAWLRLEMLTQ